MKPHRDRTGRYFLLITLPALVTLILLSSPLVPPAVATETPSTAELLTQAGEMDSSTPAAPQTETTTATITAVPTPAATTTATDSDAFDAAQLEQLVAPIALYPDALLMQILMAATYPLEIVEADRWISGQPDLKGDALNQALLEQDWDPSVESLTTLPSVLKQMSENLDWTQDLGDSFLAQEDDLLDTVQRMRGKAYEAGNLDTTEQQTVTQQADKIIVIESASPEVVYVPTYSPTVVYGPAWGYPSYYYPSYYYPPAPGYGLLAFGTGVAVGAALWGGCNWGWGNNDVNIDIDRNTEFNRNTNNNFEGGRGEGGKGEGGKGSWQHDSSHRKGVNYNNSSVAQKHGASSGSSRVTKSQARGHSSATASSRAGTGAQAGNRGSASSKPTASTANRGTGGSPAARSPSTANRGTGGSSAARSPSTASRSTGSSSALSGSRSPSTDRMSSSRGASSRGATSYGGSRGGASRGGGGRRR